ncbi:unnamed protein product [Heligmosomoides polygyrus]|uniref:Uncharacterized protein n=1 Tax=Heligmosomoides polygyrus TaxID=6339 RepID=A0A183G7I4_HELPZ|nr:unnamed protein product [Heligmosomoides polygyrus]
MMTKKMIEMMKKVMKMMKMMMMMTKMMNEANMKMKKTMMMIKKMKRKKKMVMKMKVKKRKKMMTKKIAHRRLDFNVSEWKGEETEGRRLGPASRDAHGVFPGGMRYADETNTHKRDHFLCQHWANKKGKSAPKDAADGGSRGTLTSVVDESSCIRQEEVDL